jgi:predicted transcriptional regulator
VERPKPPRPDRVRDINSGSTWGWVDHRIEWWLEDLSQEEVLLYFYLIMKSDRNGCSWCSTRTMQKQLKMGPSTIIRARQMLEERGLIATEKDELSQRYIYQVMSLPIQENERLQIPIKRGRPAKKSGTKTKKNEVSATVAAEAAPEVGKRYLDEIMGRLTSS